MESYTPNLKAYLTYPTNPTINGIFLYELYNTRHKIIFGNVCFTEYNISTDLITEIDKVGGRVEHTKVIYTTGKKEVFGIPINVKKIYENKKFTSIRIRVTGNNVNELMDKIEIIKSKLLEYGFKAKLCIWDRVLT